MTNNVGLGAVHDVAHDDRQGLVPPGSLQLETLLKGVFDKHRLLDLIRNFVVFEDDGEKVVKKLAGYHQFLGKTLCSCLSKGWRESEIFQ